MKNLPEKGGFFVFFAVLILLCLVVFSSGCVVQEELENPYGDENFTLSGNRSRDGGENIADMLKREVRERIENITIGEILDSFTQK